MINNALFCVCFLFFSFCSSFCFCFVFVFFCLGVEGGGVYVLCLCFFMFCVYVVYSWLSFGRLTFIYEKYKLSIIHYFFYYLFLQKKCVENLSMVFSIQKAKFVFIWSKWRLMGIVCRHSNIIKDFAEGMHFWCPINDIEQVSLG
jgi:hypothetical protein